MKAKIYETHKARKDLDHAPQEVLRSYEVWARLVETHGVYILRSFKGYHDEKLNHEWAGHRSSRLNLKWRVIYRISREGVLEILNVVRVTPHDYRR